MDLQGVEDIKYIKKMTTTNLQMDINNKLVETEERRNLKIKEQLKKLDDLKIKEGEDQQRRQHMHNLRLQQL